jgi:hypothetical protein
MYELSAQNCATGAAGAELTARAPVSGEVAVVSPAASAVASSQIM